MLFCDVLLKTGEKFLTDDFINGLIDRWSCDPGEFEEILIAPIFEGLTKLITSMKLTVESNLLDIWRVRKRVWLDYLITEFL